MPHVFIGLNSDIKSKFGQFAKGVQRHLDFISTTSQISESCIEYMTRDITRFARGCRVVATKLPETLIEKYGVQNLVAARVWMDTHIMSAICETSEVYSSI